jgi:hypothetical protein
MVEDLIKRIAEQCAGRDRWYVMNEAEDGYCMDFGHQLDADRWMADRMRENPDYIKRNGYHIVKQRSFKPAEALANEAAARLTALESERDALLAAAGKEAVAWQVRRADGRIDGVPIQWENCTKELYDATLATGRYAGFERYTMRPHPPLTPELNLWRGRSQTNLRGVSLRARHICGSPIRSIPLGFRSTPIPLPLLRMETGGMRWNLPCGKSLIKSTSS